MTSLASAIGNIIATPFVTVFVLTLVVLTVFHKEKLWVVGWSFIILSCIYVIVHGGDSGAWLRHFSQHDEYHLLYNLALLLPGFALLAYYFEHSGFDALLAQQINTDAKLLIIVCILSSFLDNIAAAMIGGVLVRARYGKANVPFVMLVGVICASNLGGAPSPIGDTTTVMLFIGGISVSELARSIVAAVAAMVVVIFFSIRHDREPLPQKKDRPTPVKWALLWPMLGIPGLLVGNLTIEEPGLGVWAGILVGCLIGREHFRWQEINPAGETMKGMYFLVLLVAAASMLPTEAFRPVMERMSAEGMAYTLGVLSAFFDNIPLTKFAMDLGNFDWGLLAYSVGFGGSATWFGSSAGVALGTQFPELYNTRRWLASFFKIQAAYSIGFCVYILFFSLF